MMILAIILSPLLSILIVKILFPEGKGVEKIKDRIDKDFSWENQIYKNAWERANGRK